MQYVPGFTAPAWAKDAVIYQIFPDRFRNGAPDNDPQTGDIRYDDPVLRLAWGTKPEGYCRNYADGATNCPWRFDTTPPTDSPTIGAAARPRLHGRRPEGRRPAARLPRRRWGSPRSTSTRSSTRVRTTATTPRTTRRWIPYFGTQKDFDNLVKHADAQGIRIILDGVFNHMSSRQPAVRPLSPLRDGRRVRVGVVAVPVVVHLPRSRPPAPDVCAGHGRRGLRDLRRLVRVRLDPGADQVARGRAEVLPHAPDSIAKRWLAAGAAGWRMDVIGRRVVPGRLLGVVPRRGEEHQSRRTDHQRDLAEGLHAAADAAAATGSTRR